MKFNIVSLPPFRAASSGVDPQFDFTPEGKLGKFMRYFSAIQPSDRDAFLPRDFLYFDEEQQGFVWMYALSEDIEDGGHEIIDFEGGNYVTYSYKDGDDEANKILYEEALQYISSTEQLELDIRPNHYAMGHIITPPEIIEAQGWAQMQTYVPVKLKK